MNFNDVRKRLPKSVLLCVRKSWTTNELARFLLRTKSWNNEDAAQRQDSPGSLKDLCINYVCDNIETLISVKHYEDTGLLHLEPGLRFTEHNAYLPMELSGALLTKLSLRNKLDDEILSVFNHKNVNLRNVILPKTKSVTKKGLRVLKNHYIKKLEVRGMNCTVNELVGSLGEWTKHNLEILCVSNDIMRNEEYLYALTPSGADSLSKLKSLRLLDVSNTEFNTKNLVAVFEDLPYLESLDISNTKVDTILPLKKVKNQLQKLSVFNLKEATMFLTGIDPLKCMTSLTHLDLSSEKYIYPWEPFSFKTSWLQLLTDPDWLPNLVSLDLSGSESVGPTIMKNFLTTHKKLRFLGLMFMDDCSLAMFTIPTHPLYNPDLVVTGIMTEEQILAGLKFYTKRPTYIQHCLQHLFTWVVKYYSPKVNTIELILNVMNRLSESFSVQNSAIACLNYLIKRDLASYIHPSVMLKVVEAILDAMERFPRENLLQRNILFTLCGNHILQDVKMDKFRCAKLVLDSLQNFRDRDMNSISVTICSILAAKLSTSETSQLGSNPIYMAKLLALLSDNLNSMTVDVTMKFTLSTLWNFTDESPSTCNVFIDGGGLELYLSILNMFINDSTVENKVLGLLNNIAEIPHLRHKLLGNESLIPTVCRLLWSAQIDISYFAAGVIAHLVCEPAWPFYYTINEKRNILEKLRYAVKQWVLPERAMVEYRSFQPFIGLLNFTDIPEVQLWAAWGILHVCTKNAKKYCAMIIIENGVEILQKVMLNELVDPDVYDICGRVLHLIQEFKNVRPVNPVLPVDIC